MKKLVLKSIEARKKIIEMKYKSKSSHIGSAFSVLDILIYLYFKKLDLIGKNRDRLILSKGHASSALYVTLWLKDIIKTEEIDNYYVNGGKLPGHIDRKVSPLLDASSGSLGHGLSIGAGMALSYKIDNITNRIYIILGDGELDEGSIWEAAIFISRENLDNITIVVDYNKLQGYEETEKIFSYNKIKKMWEALNFEVLEVDGHNFYELDECFNKKSNRPIVILANTIKGKGIKEIENKLEWHYKSPNLEQYNDWIKELEKYENNLY